MCCVCCAYSVLVAACVGVAFSRIACFDYSACLLYISYAADDLFCLGLVGPRTLKKNKPYIKEKRQNNNEGKSAARKFQKPKKL